MLHFHIGSQIADAQVVRQAVREITRVYAQLYERGASPRYLDVGGGLGVNYAAGYSDSEDDNGINYSLQEYANAVVYGVKEVCDATSSPCPILVSESGRAMVAHHSLLIVDVLGAYRKDRIRDDFRPGVEDHALVHALCAALNWIQSMPSEEAKVTSLLEAYHDAAEAKEQADTLFHLGYLEIEDKARTERLFWSVCDELHARARANNAAIPPELLALNEQLADQYLCNFSVFQSILDHWAIDQRFPIMPIARLNERPDRRAVLVDLTCDSDGKVEHYVTSEEYKGCLPVHSLRDGESYHLALFLMGAYQDIMGDAHNLFGPVSEAHVYADAEEPGGYYIEKVIRGITIKDMLGRVQYFPNDLNRRMSEIIRAKTSTGVLRPRAGVDLLEQYGALFDASTYLDPDDKAKR
jgi:arginine decarboxylase